MAFDFPTPEQLTPQQRLIIDQGYDKNLLVSAAPGTGKTVVALFRTKYLYDKGKKVMLLTYKRPLYLYIKSAMKKLGIPINKSNTWHSWLVEYYDKTLHNKNGYRLFSDEAYSYDWGKIIQDFSHVHDYQKYDCIFLDEAQDSPLELIKALRLVCKNISVFMDPDQSIDKNYSTEIADVAGIIGVRQYYTLRENFRNPEEIFNFSSLFLTPTDPNIKPKGKVNRLPVMKRVDTYGIPYDLICKEIEQNAHLPAIGVFVNPGKLNDVFSELSERLFGITDVYMYKTHTRYVNPDFEKQGVFILSFNCMKGLEFDEVIIPSFDGVESLGENSKNQKLLYVAVTRTKRYFSAYYRNQNPPYYFCDSFKGIRNNPFAKLYIDWN